MSESDKRIPPFGLRLPPDLKERVQEAAQDAHQSMNSLIVSVLESAFPPPLIDLWEYAKFLTRLMDECQRWDGDGSYLREINEGLAQAERPWRVVYDNGRLVFEPIAKADSA